MTYNKKMIIMKRLFLLIAAVVVVASASATEVVNYVSVIGKGEVQVAPDEFTLAITIDEQATKGRYSVEAVEKKMIAALSKIGVEREALTMSGLSSLAVKKKDALTTASYELKLNSIEQLSKTYEALDGLGITNIKISKVTHSQIEMYQSEARAAAVKDAKRRAQEVGAALGQSVGACFELTDRSSYSNDRVYVSYSASTRSDAAGAVDSTPVEFRDITITYNVDAKFVLGLGDDAQMIIVK